MENSHFVQKEYNLAVETTSETKEKLHTEIGLIIENFRRTKNRQLFYSEIDGMKNALENDKESYLLDRSWSQNQVNEALDLIESSLTSSEQIVDDGFLPWALGTEMKHADDMDPTVSDFVVQYLINRVHQNRPIAHSLEESLSVWAQSIQMADADLVNELFLAAKNNPRVIGKHFLSEARGSIAFYGKNTIDRVATVALNPTADFAEVSSAVDTLEYIYFIRDWSGYEESGDYVREILERILNERKEYFLRVRISAILEDAQLRYHDEDNLSKEKYDIPSISARPEWEQEHLVFGKLSASHGAVYSSDGNIDTVFSLQRLPKDAEREQRGENILSPRVTTLRDILIESGVEKSLCDDTYVGNYRALMEPRVKSAIEDALFIKLSDYSVRTQVALLNFLSRADTFAVNEIKELLDVGDDEQERSMIMNTFLLFEEEDYDLAVEYISAILENKEVGMPIVKKFSELINAITEAESALKEMYQGDVDQKILNEVGKRISSRAMPLLKKFYSDFWSQRQLDELAGGESVFNFGDPEVFYDTDDEASPREKARASSQEVLKEKILKEISSIEKETLLQFSSFAALKKEGIFIDLEDIKGVEFSTLLPRDLTGIEKEAMKKMYAENYEKKPNLQRTLLESFDEAINDEGENQQFRVLKRNGNIYGFYKINETAPGRFYFGAFNVDPAFHGFRLGEAILLQSLNKEVEGGKVIEGDCDREAPISSFYIENGFVGTGIFQFEEAPAMHIVKDNVMTKELFSAKELALEDIFKSVVVGEVVERNGMIFVAYPVSEIKSLPFMLLNNPASDGSRYVLTRYLRDGKEGEDIAYAVFEKVSVKDFDRLTNPVSEEKPQSQE